MNASESPDPASSDRSSLFGSRVARPERASALPWLIAGLAVLLVVLVVFLVTRPRPAAHTGVQAAAPYSSSLVIISEPQMSESSALSGVKVMYIDGQVRNLGNKTVTDATAQVQFANDEQLPPQLETVPLTLIRTHEPYVDTQPVSAAPLAPGEQREFRLIFENVGTNWNQQLPVIRFTAITTR